MTDTFADPQDGGGWLKAADRLNHVIVIKVHEVVKFMDTYDPKKPVEKDRAIVDYLDTSTPGEPLQQRAYVDNIGIVNKLPRDGRPTIGRISAVMDTRKPDEVAYYTFDKVDAGTKATAGALWVQATTGDPAPVAPAVAPAYVAPPVQADGSFISPFAAPAPTPGLQADGSFLSPSGVTLTAEQVTYLKSANIPLPG